MNLNQLLRLQSILTAALKVLTGFEHQECQRELDKINTQINIMRKER